MDGDIERNYVAWFQQPGVAKAYMDRHVRTITEKIMRSGAPLAERDPALRPEFSADMPERCSNLEMHLIKGAGHWVQQEKAGVFNAHLLDWLRRNFLPG